MKHQRRCFTLTELNEDKNTTYHNKRNAAKTVLQGKFVALNTVEKKKGFKSIIYTHSTRTQKNKSEINPTQKGEKKKKGKEERKKKRRAETSEIKNRKTKRKTNETELVI